MNLNSSIYLSAGIAIAFILIWLGFFFPVWYTLFKHSPSPAPIYDPDQPDTPSGPLKQDDYIFAQARVALAQVPCDANTEASFDMQFNDGSTATMCAPLESFTFDYNCDTELSCKNNLACGLAATSEYCCCFLHNGPTWNMNRVRMKNTDEKDILQYCCTNWPARALGPLGNSPVPDNFKFNLGGCTEISEQEYSKGKTGPTHVSVRLGDRRFFSCRTMNAKECALQDEITQKCDAENGYELSLSFFESQTNLPLSSKTSASYCCKR